MSAVLLREDEYAAAYEYQEGFDVRIRSTGRLIARTTTREAAEAVLRLYALTPARAAGIAIEAGEELAIAAEETP